MKELNEIKEKNKISLALIDSLYEIYFQKNEFLDIEIFEIQLLKYGLQLDETLKNLFYKFIDTEKKISEINEFSEILALGIKNKYDNFNEKLENLKLLYDLIIWIETHTEFNPLKYADKVFSDKTEYFYKFMSFYAFRKKNNFEITEFTGKNIELLIKENAGDEERFIALELIFENLNRTDLIVKNFLEFSKDKEFFKFIAIRKELSENEILKKITEITELDDYLLLILFILTLNPYIKIDEFKISLFEDDDFYFYQFLKAIIYRIKFYKINQTSPYEFLFFIDYLYQKFGNKKIKETIKNLRTEDIVPFEPFITYLLNKKETEYIPVLFLKIIKADIKEEDFTINCNMLNHLLNITIKNNKISLPSIFIGMFKKYFSENKNFTKEELKNFFIAVNLYLVKTENDKKLKEKLFKMNLKFFEKYIKNTEILNPIILSLSKYYSVLLNKYLKEYDASKDISRFIQNIKNLIYDNGLIVSKYTEIEDLDPENTVFTFLSTEIAENIIKNFNSQRNKITIYSEKETEGKIIGEIFYKFIIISKITLLYDLFYPLFKSTKKNKIKKDKKNIYIFDKDIPQKYSIQEIKIQKINFYYHYINKFYSLLILFLLSLTAFRIIIDSLITNDNKLFLTGIFIIFLAISIDYFLYFFFKKFEKTNFFKIKLKDKNIIFCSDEDSLLRFFTNE